MNSGKIVAGGRVDGWTEIEGSIRGPRGPKKSKKEGAGMGGGEVSVRGRSH